MAAWFAPKMISRICQCDNGSIVLESSAGIVNICNSVRIKLVYVDGIKVYSLDWCAPGEVVIESSRVGRCPKKKNRSN